MMTINRFSGWMFSTLAACSAAWLAAGCEATDILQDATAVQLETALISMMDGLLRTLIYNAMDISAI